MKKIILTISILFQFLFSFAQKEYIPFANAQWTGEHITDMEVVPDNVKHTYFSYVVQGDTILDNILRSKLYYIPDINKPDTLLIGYFHAVENIVFYRKHEIEPNVFAEGLYKICEVYEKDYPLYDFSLQEGDIYTSEICSEQREVTSIQQVEFGGFNRKKIIFNDNDSFFWIEGMGSGYGFFEGKEKIPTSANETSHYICFSINDELIYLNPRFSECPVPGFNAIPEVKTNLLTIFPNPVKLVATIQSSQPLKLIQIYDISGILLYEQICHGELQAFIDRKSLLQGTYFIKIILQNGDMQTQRLIIQ